MVPWWTLNLSCIPQTRKKRGFRFSGDDVTEKDHSIHRAVYSVFAPTRIGERCELSLHKFFQSAKPMGHKTLRESVTILGRTRVLLLMPSVGTCLASLLNSCRCIHINYAQTENAIATVNIPQQLCCYPNHVMNALSYNLQNPTRMGKLCSAMTANVHGNEWYWKDTHSEPTTTSLTQLPAC